MRPPVLAVVAALLLPGGAAAEVGDDLPDWNGCARADAPRECRGDEEAALVLLRRFWTRVPWSARKHCIADAAPARRSYVALTVCLEPGIKGLHGASDALRMYWEDMGVASEFYK